MFKTTKCFHWVVSGAHLFTATSQATTIWDTAQRSADAKVEVSPPGMEFLLRGAVALVMWSPTPMFLFEHRSCATLNLWRWIRWEPSFTKKYQRNSKADFEMRPTLSYWLLESCGHLHWSETIGADPTSSSSSVSSSSSNSSRASCCQELNRVKHFTINE